jgi:predicted NBD/HSP70 family sugar kinase
MSSADLAEQIALAVDIGGSKIEIAAIDACGRVRAPAKKHAVPFDPQGIANPARLIDLLVPHVEQARRLSGHLHGIGLSLCGNVDRETGEAVLAPNLHWRNLPFGRMVAERVGLPVYAATDVRMAAQAEALWGVAVGVRNFAWVTIGTGYGGFLFLDGKLYGGAHGFAGNFGHFTVDEVNGYPCGCGRRGCLETFVAGPAIARAGQAVLDAGQSPRLGEMAKGGRVTSQMVFQAEALGDPAAQAIIDDVIRRVAIGLGGLVTTLDLDMLILGGGVVHASPNLVPRIDTRIRHYLMTAEAKRDLRVMVESFTNSALYGAAAEVFLAHGLVTL